MKNSPSSFVEESGLKALSGIAKPLARLMLRCGIGYREFATTMKIAFVDVASEEFGLRGRSTNVSRVAALTGLSRREAKKMRDLSNASKTLLDSVSSSPLNSIIHFWRYDEDFCDSLGHPRILAFSGKNSFSELVKRYGGDVPASALKKELLLAGTVHETGQNELELRERFFLSNSLQLDVLASISSSIVRLLSTVTYNIRKLQEKPTKREDRDNRRRLERCAWTDRLSPDDIVDFENWASVNGKEFVEKADDWIGKRELRHADWSNKQIRTVGIGVYYFEED